MNKPNISGTYATIGILMIELTFWGIEDKFLWILKKQKVPTKVALITQFII